MNASGREGEGRGGGWFGADASRKRKASPSVCENDELKIDGSMRVRFLAPADGTGMHRTVPLRNLSVVVKLTGWIWKFGVDAVLFTLFIMRLIRVEGKGCDEWRRG